MTVMALLPLPATDVSGRAREWLRWAGWKAMEAGMGLVALHVVVIPLGAMLIWTVTGGRWELGPMPGWLSASLWASVPLLLAGPILMTVGDRLDARRRRIHAEEAGCPACREAVERRDALSRGSSNRDAA